MSNETSSDADWVAIALLGKPRGNRGEITALALTNKPDRFDQLERVFLSGHDQPFRIEEIWEHKGAIIFKFEGVDSISDAERYHGCEVRVPFSERAPLEAGEYYNSDLIGCLMVDRTSGEPIGTVTALQDAAGGGLLVVDGDLLVPFATGICQVIDIEHRRIEVVLPDGLLELNRP